MAKYVLFDVRDHDCTYVNLVAYCECRTLREGELERACVYEREREREIDREGDMLEKETENESSTTKLNLMNH